MKLVLLIFLLIISSLQYVNCKRTTKPNIILLTIENFHEIQNLAKYLQNNKDMTPEQSGIPNLYKLIKDSVVFENMYTELSSTSNFAALFTGKPAIESGMIRGKLLPFQSFPSLASTGGLKQETVTLAEVLKAQSYVSWFIGHWKLGFGRDGHQNPMNHGFDSWFGTGHPHSEWCHRESTGNQSYIPQAHPYTNLLYKTSFLWTVTFLLLTTLVWFRLIAWRLFLHLFIYTLFTSVAFYVLLHLFMMQRSASCVLFYRQHIYQQPYEVNNLTLYFTQHALSMMDASMAGTTPYFLVISYMKLGEPLFHSDYFRARSTNTWHSSLLELDWSIGELMMKLKEKGCYDSTYVMLTGSNNCESSMVKQPGVKILQRTDKEQFEQVEEPEKFMWLPCMKTHFFLKDIHNISTKNIKATVHTTDIYDTVIHMATDEASLVGNSLLLLYRDEQHDRDVGIRYEDIKAKVSSLELSTESPPNDGIIKKPEQTSYTEEDDRNYVLESNDTEVTVEVMEQKVNEFDFHELQSQLALPFTESRVLFHYFNVEKPVLVTYKERYQMMYAYIDENENVIRLKTPWLICLPSPESSNNTTYNNTDHDSCTDPSVLEEVYENITSELTSHLSERQHNKNMWSSQFEMPVYPWLLPCANFPYCRTVSDYPDFTNLVNSLDD